MQPNNSPPSGPKILFNTCPLRNEPDNFPPIGVLSLMNYLKKNGYNNYKLYDIDVLRPTYDEIMDYVLSYKPDILAISAVVSTAYGFVKKLSLEIKKNFPETTIILGGPIGASAEILLKKTGVDFVAAGEGEKIMLEFVKQYSRSASKSNYKTVPGLVYLDRGILVNTGYPLPVDKKEIYDVDFNELEHYSKMDHYVTEVSQIFTADARSLEKSRQNKKQMTLVTSKGCVAKCTFCHRWDKGIRYIPIPIVMQRLKTLIEKYNVGFVRIGDENFGTDKKWLDQFCKEIKTFDVLWEVGGMRVNCITDQQLKMMKDAGCVRTVFGMETGSRKMLKIMEKKVKLEDNYNALKIMYENELTTTVQLVLGMPGETNETVKETAEFVRYAAQLSKNRSPFEISINYAQALPGTPLYEYARSKGLIGSSLDDEEKYLLWCSDQDAANENFTLMLTGLPKLQVYSWRPYLVAEGAAAYKKRFGKQAYLLMLEKHFSITGASTGYFNYPKEKNNDLDSICKKIKMKLLKKHLIGLFYLYPEIFTRGKFLLYLLVFAKAVKAGGIKYAGGILARYFMHHYNRLISKKNLLEFNSEYISLRKIMNSNEGHFDKSDAAMVPLRKGRW